MESVTIEHLISFIEIHRYTGYFILFFAMVFEGEVFLIIAGMLARLKALDFGDVLWISFAGVMIGDAMWYALGMLATRSGKFAFITRYAEKSVEKFLPHFKERPFRSILLSKFIYGANHATLILSGMIRVKFSVFIRAEAYASFAWVAVYSVAGFMFGHAALAVTNKALKFVLIATIFVVVFVLIQRWAGKYYEKRELEETNNNA